MNERIDKLMINAGAYFGGEGIVYDNFDPKKFAELVVRECCDRMSKETIRHDGYGYNQHALYQILREHFGVAE